MLLTAELPGAVRVDTDRTEVLRRILSAQQKCDVSYKEAREIGDALLEFYQVLAEEVNNDPEQ